MWSRMKEANDDEIGSEKLPVEIQVKVQVKVRTW